MSKTLFRCIGKSCVPANAEILQKLSRAKNPAECGIPPCACADAHFPLFSSAQANLYLTLRTAASEYNKNLQIKDLV